MDYPKDILKCYFCAILCMSPLVKGEILFGDYTKSFSGATIYVRLEDVSKLDAPSKVISEQAIRNVSYDSDDNKVINFELYGTIPDSRASYAVSVHVDLNNDGKLNLGDLINMESYPVITYSNSNTVSVHVKEIK
jgi:uncharacterized lipoprotein YbaY